VRPCLRKQVSQLCVSHPEGSMTLWQCEAAPFGGSGSQGSIADTDREFEMQAATLWEQIESLTDWSIYPCYAVSKTSGKVACMNTKHTQAPTPHGLMVMDLMISAARRCVWNFRAEAPVPPRHITGIGSASRGGARHGTAWTRRRSAGGWEEICRVYAGRVTRILPR
jgi:hypothetical protein